ncbi:hypothetical protein RCL_jg22543.t1 [Rhizophagus clarus]|uniref:Uncharacterized protein n=1 Tax=Rhizophagus clarus TaxID=94130 RepID=A0A8H3MF47_9GLOM|nr:hypothetical protein RCL_jg22543.t1 [Rhizophagus clarus]
MMRKLIELSPNSARQYDYEAVHASNNMLKELIVKLHYLFMQVLKKITNQSSIKSYGKWNIPMEKLCNYNFCGPAKYHMSRELMKIRYLFNLFMQVLKKMTSQPSIKSFRKQKTEKIEIRKWKIPTDELIKQKLDELYNNSLRVKPVVEQCEMKFNTPDEMKPVL